MCVGDSVSGGAGTLDDVNLVVGLQSGSVNASPGFTSKTIPDDGYDGALASMGCVDINFPGP